MFVSPECDLMMTGLVELIACFTCTISLKSATSCVYTRLSMKPTSDIDYFWQYSLWTGKGLLFAVYVMFSFCQLKKSLRSWGLFSFSCRKALVSWILAFADLRIVNDASCGGFQRDFPVTVCHQIYSSAISRNDE